jgi:hypothetical protein
MIGLSGTHRTGKTTLAKAYAELAEIPYVTISVADVLLSKGWDCKDVKDPSVRVYLQEALVERCDRVFSDERGVFVSDRTPADVSAYLLADMNQNRLSDIEENKVMSMVEACIDITNGRFGTTLVLPPVLPWVSEPGKPLENRAYQMHIQHLILGSLNDQRCTVRTWYLDPAILDLEERLDVVAGIHEDLLESEFYAAESQLYKH